MKKIVTSAVLASTLFSGVAFAEQSGFFVGFEGGYGHKKIDSAQSWNGDGWNYGILTGYKYFQNERLGFRTYVTFNNAEYYSGDKGASGFSVENLNIGLNADILYNFAQDGVFEYGTFLGLGLDYATNQIKDNGALNDLKADGLDLGINLGLRLVGTGYGDVEHSVELWSRWGMLSPEFGTELNEEKARSTYRAGLRYTLSF